MLNANADALIDLTEVLTFAGQDAGTELRAGARTLRAPEAISSRRAHASEARCSRRRRRNPDRFRCAPCHMTSCLKGSP